jgi:dolichol-phosphate mannosyltransferase
MIKIPRLFIVLPAYNEEKDLPSLIVNLESVFKSLSYSGYERSYIIVDDGSVDETPKLLEQYKEQIPLTIITHSPNKGLGLTIRDGLREAAKQVSDHDIIFTMDADNSQPAGLMSRMIQMIREGNDVVIASRYRTGSRIVGLNRIRKLMSFGARLIFQIMLPIPGVRDYTCGYRAYRAEIIKNAFEIYGDAFVENRGFQCMAEILVKLGKMKAIVAEAPMILRYDKKQGASKMCVYKTVLNTLKLVVTFRFSSMPGPRLDGTDLEVHS